MSKNKVNVSEPKFTKGEKCIFTHLVMTFTFILILVIIYAIHLYLVRHTLQGVFSTRRSSFDTKHQKTTEFITPIRRSIAHTLFNRETFANNIGLLEHTESYPFLVPSFIDPAFALKSNDRKNIFIIGWNHSDIDIGDNFNSDSINYDVQFMGNDNCLEALSPVNIVRNYEYCVTFQNGTNIILGYGAVVFANSKVIGIFSWGERLQKDLPMVIINITLFQDWLKIIATS